MRECLSVGGAGVSSVVECGSRTSLVLKCLSVGGADVSSMVGVSSLEIDSAWFAVMEGSEPS